MDINAKIKWNPGMVLSSSAMSNYVENMEVRRRIAVSATLVGRFGVMAGLPFNAQGFFVKDHYEIPSLKCSAILPSGEIINADEDVCVTIPKLEPGDHYLCIGIGEKDKEFENGTNTYVRAMYDYSLVSLSDIDARKVFPVAKFSVQDNTIKIDKDYIAPCIQMSSDSRLLDWRDVITDSLEKILDHPNFCNDIAKGNIFNFLIRLRAINGVNDTCSFLQTTAELAQVINYFLIKPYTSDETETEVPEMSPYDCAKWLNWLESYMKSAQQVLDGVERTDNEIDIEALKREICESVTQTLRDELQEKIMASLRPAMEEEVDRRIKEILKDYIDGTVRTQMHDTLQDELSEGLKASLYDVLYNALYEALYVPEKKEEDNFMPMI